MKLIQCLSEKIDAELEDATSYITLALKLKDDHPDTACLYRDLSREEMDHVERLHKRVVCEIEAYRSRNGEPPANMLAVYNYLHDKQVDCANQVKLLISSY